MAAVETLETPQEATQDTARVVDETTPMEPPKAPLEAQQKRTRGRPPKTATEGDEPQDASEAAPRDELQSQRRDIETIMNSVERVQDEMDVFRDFMLSIKAERQSGFVTQGPRKQTDPEDGLIALDELERLAEAISAADRKASEVGEIRMHLEILKARVKRLEAISDVHEPGRRVTSAPVTAQAAQHRRIALLDSIPSMKRKAVDLPGRERRTVIRRGLEHNQLVRPREEDEDPLEEGDYDPVRRRWRDTEQTFDEIEKDDLAREMIQKGARKGRPRAAPRRSARISYSPAGDGSRSVEDEQDEDEDDYTEDEDYQESPEHLPRHRPNSPGRHNGLGLPPRQDKEGRIRPHGRRTASQEETQRPPSRKILWNEDAEQPREGTREDPLPLPSPAVPATSAQPRPPHRQENGVRLTKAGTIDRRTLRRSREKGLSNGHKGETTDRGNSTVANEAVVSQGSGPDEPQAPPDKGPDSTQDNGQGAKILTEEEVLERERLVKEAFEREREENEWNEF